MKETQPTLKKICLLQRSTHHLGDSDLREKSMQNRNYGTTWVQPGWKSKPTLSPWASRSGIYGNQALGSTDSTKQNTTQLALERMQISIDRSHH